MHFKICFYFIFFFLTSTGFGQSPTEVDFIWKSAESESQKFEKAVMLIPLKFQGDTTTYFLQFDTGATFSSIYANRLNKLKNSTEDLKTSLGRINFRENKSMKASTEKIFSVGTLGADFLKGKTVQIDFKNQIIKINQFYDPAEYELQALEFLNGRPVIKVTMNTREQKLLYDTGSSLFGILTTKRNWNKWRDKTENPESFPISSWGEINRGVYNPISPSATVSFEDMSISDNLYVWYVENKKFRRFFRKNDLFGLVGNQPFLATGILLDYKNKLVGIKKTKGKN